MLSRVGGRHERGILGTGEVKIVCMCLCYKLYDDGVARDETGKKVNQILEPLKWRAGTLGLYPENNREQ